MEEELRKLGLGEYESKVYIALLVHGSMNGRETAKLSSVPQSKVYEVLYRLAEKKFVSILDARPKQFRAVEPGIAVRHHLASKKGELEELEKTLPPRLESAAKSRHREPRTQEIITVYRGEKSTHPVVMHKYLAAKMYVKDMFTFEYVPESMTREVVKCIERGVKIYMLATMKTKENRKLMQKMKKLGVEVRYFPVKEIRLAVCDGTESYQMIVNQKNMMDRVSIVIQSLELTRALEHYFDYLWGRAERV
ncbi:hypothetical protein HYV82_04710 [Candidatus Woesearchaeota archaeon]|nr:hypothetical protein [Candidatus Woesearchaeota archaeon]